MWFTPKFRKELADEEFAHAYVDELLNTHIATQLKVLREQRKLTQEELANLAGMKQERISVLENVNYSSWSINTLRKLAKALDVRLRVSFETFGSLVADMTDVSRQSLERISRKDELDLDNKLAEELDKKRAAGILNMGGGSSMPGGFLAIPGTDRTIESKPKNPYKFQETADSMVPNIPKARTPILPNLPGAHSLFN
ncbi:MAG: helix-turn-helix domain-containing protein [Steroidobacteraceae bacterium]